MSKQISSRPDDTVYPLVAQCMDLLTPQEERQLLKALAACRTKLLEALGRRVRKGPVNVEDCRAIERVLKERASGARALGARATRHVKSYLAIRDRLALANVRLVASVAQLYLSTGMQFGDLVQEGFLGLLAAIDRFDVARPTKLSTYAHFWIRRKMQTAVAAGVYPVRLNANQIGGLSKYRREQHASGKPGDEPADTTLTPSTRARIARLEAATSVPCEFTPEHEPEPRLLRSTFLTRCDEAVRAIDALDAIGPGFELLSERERMVLRLRFGLGEARVHTLAEIGEHLRLSRERVRQIQRDALDKLRKGTAPSKRKSELQAGKAGGRRKQAKPEVEARQPPAPMIENKAIAAKKKASQARMPTRKCDPRSPQPKGKRKR